MLIVIDTESSPEEIIGEFAGTEEDAVQYWDERDGSLQWAPADCVRVAKGHRPGGPGHRLVLEQA